MEHCRPPSSKTGMHNSNLMAEQKIRITKGKNYKVFALFKGFFYQKQAENNKYLGSLTQTR